MDKIIDKRIFDLIKRISDDLGKDWTVEAMAVHADLSVPHFGKLFKHEMEMPPMTWHHDHRLERVAEFLLTTYLPIKVIGVKTGLTDQTHLTRDFKKKFGMTPTGYRKHHAEIEQLEAQIKKSESQNGQK